jgi:hypothetical protein
MEIEKSILLQRRVSKDRVVADPAYSSFAVLKQRKPRFSGAGATSLREFRRRRRVALRKIWRDLSVIGALAIGAALAAWFFEGSLELFFAGFVGAAITLLAVLWIIGGHPSSLPWWWGAQGEQFTAEEIEKLSAEWHCEHDIEHEYGNWDHVLVGPPGIFLLDSKTFSNKSVAVDDTLRSGRLVIRGRSLRSGAWAIRDALVERFGDVPWVQAVVVIWGTFPQEQHKENKVVYLRGDKLREWLTALPPRLEAPQRAAICEALREVRGLQSSAAVR